MKNFTQEEMYGFVMNPKNTDYTCLEKFYPINSFRKVKLLRYYTHKIVNGKLIQDRSIYDVYDSFGERVYVFNDYESAKDKFEELREKYDGEEGATVNIIWRSFTR